MEGLLTDAVITGNGFTVVATVTGTAFEHPVSVLVPITEYTVLAGGIKATPLVAAGLHVYVWAPAAFSVMELPEQTTALFTEAVMIGKALTVTCTVARLVLVQPVRVLVPVTEYVALSVGENEVPLGAGGFQVYVSAPLPVSERELPMQTAGVLAAAETTGRLLTVIVTAATLVLAHPVRVFVPATE